MSRYAKILHFLILFLPNINYVLTHQGMFFLILLQGRVTMAMTTLLTLASMFGSLTNITPPISYHTRLDVWMISCIVFVFASLAEFTLVIFLKYYLPHLPLDWFHKLCLKARTPPSSAIPVDKSKTKSSFVRNERTNAWVSNQKNIRQRTMTPVVNVLSHQSGSNDDHEKLDNGNKKEMEDDSESIPEEQLLDERKEMAEKVIKIIDKYSVIFFFLSYAIFVSIYWYSLLTFFGDR